MSISFRARLRRHGWIVFLAVTAALAAPYLAFRGTAINSGPVFNLFGAASVAAILVSARINRVARFPWILIAIGLAAFVTGDVLAYNYQRFFGTELPFPSIADLFYLATYPFLIAGLLLLIRKRTPTQDRASLIDTLIVTTASGALLWAGLIAGFMALGIVTMFVGLVVVFPLIGHATWHAYRDLVPEEPTGYL